jgi:energy-converting hydrogenase Eha subunit E
VNETPRERTASRWGAVLIAICIAMLIALLPRRYHLTPTWFAYTGAAFMVLPMLAVLLAKGNPLTRRVERVTEFVAVGAALLFNALNLLLAAYNLVENPGTLEPVTLFYTSVGIWFGNILIFTLVYWLVDGGGPEARLNGRAIYPDFDFPAMDESARVPPGWQPGIADYLFVAFTTNTAFSPTEAMPMTTRAKVLVMVQSSISLITIAIVAARTINILK